VAERTLWYAAWSGDVRLARELLAEGADPDKGTSGKTPLMEAVDEPGEFFDENHLAIAELLVDAGADYAARDPLGRTALHCAARAEVRATELLLRAGANPNTSADDGTTPLHEAATCGNLSVVRALIDAGADMAAATAAGETPFDAARREQTLEGSPDLFQLLGHNEG
jgi:cytohesin